MRLLTYNIHKGVGSDRRYRLERIIHVIREQNPDLICLQEVDRNVRRSRYHDQPALLADHLGTEAYLYQLNVPHREGGYGNLILSRWPFRSQQHVSLRHRRRKPRGASSSSSRRRRARCTWSTGTWACANESDAGRRFICSITVSSSNPPTCPRSSPAITTIGVIRWADIISSATAFIRPPRPPAVFAAFRLSSRWPPSTRCFIAVISTSAMPASCATAWPAALPITFPWSSTST